jgi:hypothetical protein
MIEILRLKTGEDIIGDVYNLGVAYEIHEPMTVDIDYRGKESGLIMQHWLPVQLITENHTVIKMEDVLTKFEPNKEFTEYYKNTVEKINELLKAKQVADSMTDEEINSLMDVLEESYKHTLH